MPAVEPDCKKGNRMIILQLALYCALFMLIWIAGAAIVAGIIVLLY